MTGDATYQHAHPSVQAKCLSDFGEKLLTEPQPFRQGAYGWLYDMRTTVHTGDGQIDQLLKILKTPAAEAEFAREIAALARLAGSPGVPRIMWNGNALISGTKYAAFSYVKIQPAAPLEFLERRRFRDDDVNLEATAQTLFDLGLRLLETIEIVHQSAIRHLDIHPANILVSGTKSIRGGEPPFNLDIWLIDFGKSAVPWKFENESQLSNELPELMSDDQKNYLIRNQGRYRRDDNVLRSERSMLWDLHAIGYSFSRLATKFEFREEEQSHRDALFDFASLLQSRDKGYAERMKQARDCASLWRNAIPRLNQIKVRTFVASHTTIDPALTPVVDSAPVQRLRQVQQLALTQILYPGATHTRFAHTLGVVDIATKYIDQINLASPVRLISPRERLTCLSYALLHDIGHYAFAHYLEEIDAASLPNLAPLLHHEVIGKATYLPDSRLPWLFSPRLAAALDTVIPGFNASTFLDALGDDKSRTVLGEIVDGPIDADKIDYLLRDGNACGIAYANGIDVERLLDSIRVVESSGEMHLGISAKGVAPASEMYYARFHMYTEVYYHKVSRFIAAAVKRAFFLCVSGAAPEETEKILVKLLTSSEFQVIDWLKLNLKSINDGRFLPLLDQPFGEEGRRLFKRLKTYSDLWLADNASRSREKRILDKIRAQAISFAKLGELEIAVCAALDSALQLEGAKRSCVLIDVPRSKGVPEFPLVLGARTPEFLNKISPIVDQAANAQGRSQRVRVFASRPTADALVRKYPRPQQRDQFLDDLLLAILETPTRPTPPSAA